jgi:hypothetical protein
MRTILIDPEQQTVTEIQIAGGDDLDELYRVLKCKHITSGAHLRGNLIDGFDSIFVSDDLLEDRDDPRFWFQVDADRNPPSSFPIAGLGLAHGTDREGAMCDVIITAAELAKRITFTQRKFRGFETRRIGPRDIGGGLIGVGLQIDPIAPIVDGANE